MGKEHEVSARFSSHGLRANGSRLKSPMALRLRFLGRPALFVSGLLVLALIFPAAALAGSNGQQIAVYAPSQKSVKICGNNQNGTYTCVISNTPYRTTSIPHWWWKESVVLYNYADPEEHFFLGRTGCTVPVYQANSDWTTCNGVRARGNQDQYQWNWWGLRVWVDHSRIQAAWQQVKAAGSLAVLPSTDVGYGVVMDISARAPFYSCSLPIIGDAMKMWSQ